MQFQFIKQMKILLALLIKNSILFLNNRQQNFKNLE